MMATVKTSAALVLLLSSMYFVREISLQDLSYITDEQVKKAVEEFIEYCPYTSICGYRSNKTVPLPTNQSSDEKSECCGYCLCTERCGRSCCPDKPTQSLTNEEVLRIRQDTTRCLHSQYKHSLFQKKITNTAYLTVASCPLGFKDGDISSKCTRDNQDFDFQEGLSYFVPVSSNNTIFKNKYCAVCNGASNQSLDLWDIELQCDKYSVYAVGSNIEELRKEIDKNENCDFFFFPSNRSNTFIDEICSPLIDRCNVSGKWQHYDSDTERACLSYESAFKSVYKNVHCYICNEGQEEHLPDLCEYANPSFNPSSFVALLDFNSLQQASTAAARQFENCQPGYMYDAIQEKCRQLFCPHYRYINNGTCTSILSFGDQVTVIYDVIITVEPRDSVKTYNLIPGTIELLYSALWDQVSKSLESRQSELSICQLFGVIFLRPTFEALVGHLLAEGRTQLVYSEIEYFAFRLQVTGRGGLDLEKEFLTLDISFQNSSQVPALLPYTIRYRQIPTDIFDFASLAIVRYHFEGHPQRDALLNTLELDSMLRDSLAASFQHGSDGPTIAPLYEFTRNSCLSMSKYHIQTFCPKLQFFANEYSVTEDGIVLDALGLFLSNLEVEFTANNSILVCYKTYMLLIKDVVFRSQSVNVPNQTGIQIVTALALAMSLISLSVTFTIYTLFKDLRTLPGLNIMGLTSSLFVAHLLTFLNSVVETLIGYPCIVVGVLVHLSLLLSISWMFVCTFHMAKVFISLEKMNPRHTNKYHSFTRYTVFTTVFSSVFVVTNIAVSSVRSNGSTIGYDEALCFIESRDMLIFTVALPIGVAIIANIIMFVCVVFKVGKIPSVHVHRQHERNNIAIFTKLSTITGITWIFAFLYQFTAVEAFSYIFVILNGSQGVFIMVAFIANKRVAGMFKNRFEHSFHSSDTSALHSHHHSNDNTNEHHHEAITGHSRL